MMRISSTIYVMSACAFVLFLAGCQDVKETFGVDTRQVPDEFAVVKNAPLTLPPDYNLRPPRPGAPRPQTIEAEDTAKEVVTGQEVKRTGSDSNDLTDGENLFLKQAGTDIANPNIREQVDSEQRIRNNENVPVAKRLLGIGISDEEPATIVDAKKERERIKNNLEKGGSLGAGETPSIED